MDFQTIAVTVLVGLSFVYATQALMPIAWRVRVLGAMARWPLPTCVTDRLSKKLQKIASCGCDGCDQAQAKGNSLTGALLPGESKIHFMPRRRA
jgi:hypothetical protein